MVYRHDVGVGLNDHDALQALRRLLNVCEQVYMKHAAIFGGVDPSALVDALIGRQFEVANKWGFGT